MTEETTRDYVTGQPVEIIDAGLDKLFGRVGEFIGRIAEDVPAAEIKVGGMVFLLTDNQFRPWVDKLERGEAWQRGEVRASCLPDFAPVFDEAFKKAFGGVRINTEEIDPPGSRRLGRFALPVETWQALDLSKADTLFAGMVVVGTELDHMTAGGRFIYTALHRDFAPIQRGSAIPEYVATFKDGQAEPVWCIA